MPRRENTEANLAQSMAALARANEIRVQRSAFRRAVERGEVALVDVFTDPPEALRVKKHAYRQGDQTRPTVGNIINWAPGWGPSRVNNFLKRVDVSGKVLLHDLSPATRERIVDALRACGDGFTLPDDYDAGLPDPQVQVGRLASVENTIPRSVGTDLADCLRWAVKPAGKRPDIDGALRRFEQAVKA